MKIEIDTTDLDAMMAVLTAYGKTNTKDLGKDLALALEDVFGPSCMAHGQQRCEECSRIALRDMAGAGGCLHCHSYLSTGMHWDTCRGRIPGPVFPDQATAMKAVSDE